jgi:hypothetical protein
MFKTQYKTTVYFRLFVQNLLPDLSCLPKLGMRRYCIMRTGATGKKIINCSIKFVLKHDNYFICENVAFTKLPILTTATIFDR